MEGLCSQNASALVQALPVNPATIQYFVPLPAADITGLGVVPHAQSLSAPPGAHPPLLTANPSLYRKVMIPKPYRVFVSGNSSNRKHIKEAIIIIIVYIRRVGKCLL